MTVPQIKVKVVRRPQIKVKALVKFPANVIATSPITLTNIGGTYTFGIDYSLFGTGLFTPGAIPFANALGGLAQDPALSWDNTLKKLNLNLSGSAMAAAETDTGFQMDGADGFATTIFMDSHGATAALDFRQQGGTKAAPTATATGATMGQINFQGWDSAAYGKSARVRATAEPSGATWTPTDHGVGIGIFTTAPGTTSLSEKFHVYGNGGLATTGLASQGAGTLNLAALYSNNTLIVDSSGNITSPSITSSGNLSLGGANTFKFTGRSIIQSGSDGDLTLMNNTGSAFTSLKFGGATASFPEIKRNGTAINFRLADDSADAPITAASFNGNFITTGTGTLTLTGNLTVNSTTAISAGVAGQVGVWNAGNLSGSATPTLGAAGTLGSVTFGNATSGLLTLRTVTGALGTVTVSLPAATDTLIGKATTDTLTNKTFDTAGAGNSLSINGVAVTANTGTGAVARAAGPTFTTPALGAATATSINGNTFTTGTYTLTGVAAKTLTFNNSLTLAGTDATTITFQGTDTYVGRATTDTFTNKTFNTASAGNVFQINGNTISSSTGTGAVNVLQTSPTLITPLLGTPTSGTLTNCTGLPLAGLAAQAAFTFVGNNTSGSAVPTAVDIHALTLKASPAATDEVIISDQAASGAWKRASVSSLASAGSVSSIAGNTGAFTLSGILANSVNDLRVVAATKSDQQTGTSTTTAVTPAQQQQHDSSCKAWARVTQSGTTYTVAAGYNIASVVRNSIGNITVNFTTAFATSSWSCCVTAASGGSAAPSSFATGSVVVLLSLTTTGAAIDNTFDIHCFGRQ